MTVNITGDLFTAFTYAVIIGYLVWQNWYLSTRVKAWEDYYDYEESKQTEENAPCLTCEEQIEEPVPTLPSANG